METSTMIRQLRRTAKKHENDKLHTFDTDMSLMCNDVANRLEKLEKEKQEIRNKVIDEFVNLINECSGYTPNCIEHDLSLTVYTIHQIAEQLKKEGEL